MTRLRRMHSRERGDALRVLWCAVWAVSTTLGYGVGVLAASGMALFLVLHDGSWFGATGLLIAGAAALNRMLESGFAAWARIRRLWCSLENTSG